MNVRQKTEALELQNLSPYAACSSRTIGRRRVEEPCEFRTEYQRDRDRILHCNAFKRLKHKTQVFLSPRRDHYRTRLVHSLEVAQIARTAARGLRLNEDLTEAIALGHDLGHAPFGHAGELALNQICPHSFRHADNSVRVVTELEKEGQGLNLTAEVIDGIACHSSGQAKTLEGKLVKVCDKVAYVNHDIEDAIRAGVISYHDLPYQCVYILGNTKSKRITTVIRSLIENSSDSIQMSPEVDSAHQKLRSYMFEHVYAGTVAQQEEEKAKKIVEMMYTYYRNHVEEMPLFYQEIAGKSDIDRAVCDYISGMSDNYIIEQYSDRFIPRRWSD